MDKKFVRASFMFESTKQTETSLGDAMLKAIAKKEGATLAEVKAGVQTVLKEGVK
jgi:hypothetical protein